jgi:hypothetical protein
MYAICVAPCLSELPNDAQQLPGSGWLAGQSVYITLRHSPINLIGHRFVNSKAHSASRDRDNGAEAGRQRDSDGAIASSAGVPQPEFCGTRNFRNYLILLAHRAGFEPTTPRFVVWCSIQLSYRCLASRGQRHWQSRRTEVGPPLRETPNGSDDRNQARVRGWNVRETLRERAHGD